MEQLGVMHKPCLNFAVSGLTYTLICSCGYSISVTAPDDSELDFALRAAIDAISNHAEYENAKVRMDEVRAAFIAKITRVLSDSKFLFSEFHQKNPPL